jgi:uncharacterized membrane protein (DUF485 family)
MNKPFLLIPIFIWIGFVCSISFMEAWLKFRAPHVSLAVGLSIGQLVFAALNRVEWGLAGCIAVLVFISKRRPKRENPIFFYIPVSILILQTSFLLPSLNEKAQQVMQGTVPSPSLVHFSYIFLEVVKVVSLFIWGVNILCNAAIWQKKEKDLQ